MKAFTYFLRSVAAFVFIIATCNTNINNIPAYIIVTLSFFAISVTLWQCANALDEPDEVSTSASAATAGDRCRNNRQIERHAKHQHTHCRLPVGGVCTPERLQPSKQLKKGA
jgi:hypothetical protein